MKSLEFDCPIKIKPSQIIPFGKSFKTDPLKEKFYSLFDDRHPGIDYHIPIGTNIYASFSGIVVRRENHHGMGNVLGIRNGNIVALYAHLSKFSAQLGQKITKGKLIGWSGDTGNTCLTPHLHFELRDITKKSLAEMVFNPIDKKLNNYLEEFEYVVNNKTTQKTLSTLSILFYGCEDFINHLKKRNGLRISNSVPLSEGLTIIIPNYY